MKIAAADSSMQILSSISTAGGTSTAGAVCRAVNSTHGKRLEGHFGLDIRGEMVSSPLGFDI